MSKAFRHWWRRQNDGHDFSCWSDSLSLQNTRAPRCRRTGRSRGPSHPRRNMSRIATNLRYPAWQGKTQLHEHPPFFFNMESVHFFMPTVLRVHGYRFFFFSNEASEPMHIHVEQAGRYAKFWLNPMQLAESRGFRSKEIPELRTLLAEHKETLAERWNEHFGDKG